MSKQSKYFFNNSIIIKLFVPLVIFLLLSFFSMKHFIFKAEKICLSLMIKDFNEIEFDALNPKPFFEKVPNLQDDCKIAIIEMNKQGNWLLSNLKWAETSYFNKKVPLTEEQKEIVENSLKKIRCLTWESVLLSTTSSPEISLTQMLTGMLDFSIFSSEYLCHKKLNQPDFDIAKDLSQILKICSLINLLDKNVINHNDSLKIYNSVNLALNELYINKTLNFKDCTNLLRELKLSDLTKISLSQSLAKEQNSRAKTLLVLHEKEPFGALILSKFFNLNSNYEFFDLINQVPTANLVKQFKTKFPTPKTNNNQTFINRIFNFYPASINYETFLEQLEFDFKYMAQRQIIKQSLASIIGSKETFPDPFTKQKLLTKKAGEQDIFYSAGPNQIDDGMSGDDIFFKIPE